MRTVAASAQVLAWVFLLCLVSAVSLAQEASYSVTATMPATEGATGCELYLDGEPVGGVRACDSPQEYPGLLAGPGTYAFSYRAHNAAGVSALSPVATVSITVVPPPVDPTEPPQVITVTCMDAQGNTVACPASIAIAIGP